MFVGSTPTQYTYIRTTVHAATQAWASTSTWACNLFKPPRVLRDFALNHARARFVGRTLVLSVLTLDMGRQEKFDLHLCLRQLCVIYHHNSPHLP